MSPEQPCPNLRARQAAVVLQALDPELLRAVESRLSEDERRALEAARHAGENVPPEERLRLLEALTRPHLAPSAADGAGLCRAPGPDDKSVPAILRPRHGDTARLSIPAENPVDLDAMLREYPDAVAHALRREGPEVVALVLGAVSPDAADLALACLPSDLARQAVLRMAQGGLRPAPGALRCVAEAVADAADHYRCKFERQAAHARLIARTILDDEPESVSACLEALRVQHPALAAEVEAWLDAWAGGKETAPADAPEPDASCRPAQAPSTHCGSGSSPIDTCLVLDALGPT